jgi:aspartyl-tRNA(Asn)/glutamyl-tRNA(Gln) amidotransferase subunit C
MKLSKDEVKKIAQLSSLELSDEEVELYSTQLSDVLDYMDQLNEVNTDGVEETSQVTGLENVYRKDIVEQCELQEELVNAAPEHDDNLIQTKAIL